MAWVGLQVGPVPLRERPLTPIYRPLSKPMLVRTASQLQSKHFKKMGRTHDKNLWAEHLKLTEEDLQVLDAQTF